MSTRVIHFDVWHFIFLTLSIKKINYNTRKISFYIYILKRLSLTLFNKTQLLFVLNCQYNKGTMSGYLGRQRVMEPSTSTSSHTNASTSTLGCSNTARSSGDRSSGRLINGRVRKESKYIENSRQDKLFSRVWLPSQTNLSPKVRKSVYNI